jgi:hypothetical protein
VAGSRVWEHSDGMFEKVLRRNKQMSPNRLYV